MVLVGTSFFLMVASRVLSLRGWKGCRWNGSSGIILNGPGVSLVHGEDGRLFYWMDGAFLAVDGEAGR